MRFHRFFTRDSYPDKASYFAYMERVKEHWRSFGWEEIPKHDEAAIKAAWSANLEPERGVVKVPIPSRCWRHISTKELGERADELEAEFTMKILAAFRRCTCPGERLLAIDWQHSWYYFDPHGPISVAARDEWAMPVLPGVESYNFVAADFRFGVLTGFDECWFLSLFGAELLGAFADDPPWRFLRTFGSGAV